MNSDNKTDFQKYVEESEKERALHKEKVFQDYKDGNEEYRQEYWNRYIFQTFWYNERGTSLPNDIKELRKIEEDFEKYILGIMESLEDEGFTGDINDIFILDEEILEYLRGIGYFQKHDTKKKIIEIIENKKEQDISGENISFDELVERIGDLYYDSFASFLENLGEYIYNEEVKKIVKQSSENIKNAWILCKPEVEKFIKKGGEVGKHNNEVKGIKTSNEELAKIIGNLVDYKLSDFLKELSEKIQKDGEADKGRGRIKLARELFDCANKLKEASEIL